MSKLLRELLEAVVNPYTLVIGSWLTKERAWKLEKKTNDLGIKNLRAFTCPEEPDSYASNERHLERYYVKLEITNED